MEAVLRKHPEYKLLGKSKFVKVMADNGIDREEAKQYYDTLELGQIYAPPKQKDKLVITAPPYSFQVDIFELPAYKTSNSGVYKCFLAVDILSRKAFAYPLKSGRIQDVLKVYEQFLIDADQPLNSVAGDAFFDNQVFKTFNDEMYIEVYTDVAKDDHITNKGDKLGIIDRATRTLKKYIQKYMLQNDTTKWTAFLPEILELYNNTPHSAHSSDTTPSEVYDDVDYMRKLHKSQAAKNRAATSEFKAGDIVRLLQGRGAFDKEKATYTTETYRIVEQQGYKYVIEGKKRKYRPSEMVLAKQVKEHVKGGARKAKAEKTHRNTKRVMQETGKDYNEAERAVQNVKPKRTIKTRAYTQPIAIRAGPGAVIQGFDALNDEDD